MLELILTRPRERKLIAAAHNLRFLVLDELHTYRGRQGADVSMLIRRLRDHLASDKILCVGTSATMGGDGSPSSQKETISEVASMLFGTEVKASNVIGEKLRPATDVTPPEQGHLRSQLDPLTLPDSADPEQFVQHPLARWVEGNFGLTTDEESGELVRAPARPIGGDNGAAQILAEAASIDRKVCEEAIRRTLMAGYQCQHAQTNRPLFAFRLHQFISKGGTVFASLESPSDRHITLNGQQYVPGDRDRVLLPLVFCRECGQEYYCVSREKNALGVTKFAPRDLGEQKFDDDDLDAGFLVVNEDLQWPEGNQESQFNYVPDDWLEEATGGGLRKIRTGRRKSLPVPLAVNPLGESCEDSEGTPVTFLGAPFRFCPRCKVSYDFRQRSDIAKLTMLGTEGRSMATTILSLFTLLGLEDQVVPEQARKLLSFTDNRQDASLQAGHYNDFIEVGLLRAALFRAVSDAGAMGLAHEELAQSIFTALGLPFSDYASDPGVKGLAERGTRSALREVLTYRIFRDLKRGWRVLMPNLEQCGLLKIDYEDLDTLCADDEVWNGKHSALVSAEPGTRAEICRTLLDFMRRGLAIKVEFLDEEKQEQIKTRSSQRLRAPWALEDDERLEHAAILFPRPRGSADFQENLYVSPRGGFGMYLRRSATFPDHDDLTTDDAKDIISDLLEAMKIYGLVEEVIEPDKAKDLPGGYQLQAAAMRWKAGDGTSPFHDRIRMPGMSEEGGRTNPFFAEFYRRMAMRALGTEALEHTAQIPSAEREEREHRFRRGSLPADSTGPKGLPILYCSPTMELGIDITELNVVNMRNVPPTPANYAQRSGRAGRSGSPALVVAYCTIGNSHDQYFFNRPQDMVSGSVSPPRIELANEDLIRAHVYAIWLFEAQLELGQNLTTHVLKVVGDAPTLELQESIHANLLDPKIRAKAEQRAERILAQIHTSLAEADWWSEDWIERTVNSVERQFQSACDRWRTLYRAALNQYQESARIIVDASRPHRDKKRAEALQREAKQQLDLLTDDRGVIQSDFYSYRYFASEGFLPGYSFPRLPLSAYIPGRRRKKNENEFVSRPRFLAISEFGPQAIIYHAGRKYQITRALLPLTEDGDLSNTRKIKLCPSCGYLHSGGSVETLSNCDSCGTPLAKEKGNLFRMENVSTRRRERISSDEEERFRQGFQIITGVRFPERDGQPSYRQATIEDESGSALFTLHYGSAATLWRINLGWKRRKPDDPEGFLIDLETGKWETSRERDTAEDDEVAGSNIERVIPYVEDRRNALLIEPAMKLEQHQMASLQAALKQGVQLCYQLEESELAAEGLPRFDLRTRILFFESAEGGAGVLRQLLKAPSAFAEVARKALEVCHFDPDTGTDLKRSPGMKEDCEAACYRCLLNYSNQREHSLIDRKAIKDVLMTLSKAITRQSEGPKPRGEHLADLIARCDSGLEKQWLAELDKRNLRLPTHAQHHLKEFNTRPDFFYREHSTAIYVDGHHHDFPDRAQRDHDQEELLEANSIRVIRFHHADDWEKTFNRYQFLFGTNV
ncbi:MAG: DUF1998 domain-containing protein [Verrucomicrobiae bacterium]|nr:DUF1998 domain-containing protein [Verrucomicrobiae bacterium]